MAVRKAKSGHCSVSGWGDGFSEKKESRNISLQLLLFSLPFFIVTTLITIMTSIDHRERTTPFGILGRYLAQLRKSNLFLVAIIMFFSLLPPCILCTFAQSGGQLHQGIKEYGIRVIPRMPRGNITESHSWLSRGSGLHPALSCQRHGDISPSLLYLNDPWGLRLSWCSHRWRAGWRQTSVGCNAMRFSFVSLPRLPISSTAGCSSHKDLSWISARWSGHWSLVLQPMQAYHRWVVLSPNCGCLCCGLSFVGNGVSLSSGQHWHMWEVSHHTSEYLWIDRRWTHVAFRCFRPCIG